MKRALVRSFDISLSKNPSPRPAFCAKPGKTGNLPILSPAGGIKAAGARKCRLNAKAGARRPPFTIDPPCKSTLLTG